MSNVKTLDPEFKQLWVDALRSGYYEQTRGRLYNRGRYCCLGVACDLLAPYELKETGAFICKSLAFIESETADEIGLARNDQNDLAALNDEYKRSFKQIADYIERKL